MRACVCVCVPRGRLQDNTHTYALVCLQPGGSSCGRKEEGRKGSAMCSGDLEGGEEREGRTNGSGYVKMRLGERRD